MKKKALCYDVWGRVAELLRESVAFALEHTRPTLSIKIPSSACTNLAKTPPFASVKTSAKWQFTFQKSAPSVCGAVTWEAAAMASAAGGGARSLDPKTCAIAMRTRLLTLSDH